MAHACNKQLAYKKQLAQQKPKLVYSAKKKVKVRSLSCQKTKQIEWNPLQWEF